MLFWNKICGLKGIIFICVLNCDAQQVSLTKTPAPKASLVQYNRQVSMIPEKEIKKEEIFSPRPFAIIPQNYYTQHFGIMCRKELALEKATKIPFRFRLGSLQQCNYFEGKR